jgi:hypothetical protein
MITGESDDMRWMPKEVPLIQEWFAWYPVYCRDAKSWVWWEKVFIRWLSGGDSGLWDHATKRETHEW